MNTHPANAVFRVLQDIERKSHGGVWRVTHKNWQNQKYREETQREADERGYRIIVEEPTASVSKITKCIPLSHWMDLDYREKIIAWADAEGVELVIDTTLDKMAEGQISDRHQHPDTDEQWDKDLAWRGE